MDCVGRVVGLGVSVEAVEPVGLGPRIVPGVLEVGGAAAAGFGLGTFDCCGPAGLVELLDEDAPGVLSGSSLFLRSRSVPPSMSCKRVASAFAHGGLPSTFK